MKCPECKTYNKDKSKFCNNCGEKLSKLKSKSVIKNLAEVVKSNKQFGMFLSIFLVGIIIVLILTNKPIRSNNHFADKSSDNPRIEFAVYDIAAKFYCACGKCKNEPLDKCKCSYATEGRQFIRNFLEKGNSQEEIILAVDKKYGGLKSGKSKNGQ